MWILYTKNTAVDTFTLCRIGETKQRNMQNPCTVLYSTVLYCTVLYCTVPGAHALPDAVGGLVERRS